MNNIFITDFHSHAFPDALARKALCALSERSGEYRPHTEGTIASLLGSMDDAGVSRSVVASIATKPAQFAPILEWSLSVKSSRIVPLASVHPLSGNFEAEIDAAADAGFPGIKLHPLYQSFVVDDKKVYPLYDKIRSRGMFILFHAGYDIAYPGDESASARRIARMIKDFPDLAVIASHLGGWKDWENVDECLAGKNIYLETSFISMIEPSLRNRILGRHPREMILFGSDSPWLKPSDEIRAVESLGLSDSDLEKIFSLNAKKLIG